MLRAQQHRLPGRDRPPFSLGSRGSRSTLAKKQYEKQKSTSRSVATRLPPVPVAVVLEAAHRQSKKPRQQSELGDGSVNDTGNKLFRPTTTSIPPVTDCLHARCQTADRRCQQDGLDRAPVQRGPFRGIKKEVSSYIKKDRLQPFAIVPPGTESVVNKPNIAIVSASVNLTDEFKSVEMHEEALLDNATTPASWIRRR
ncbi:elongation factor 1 alpha [Culex quinquefasciatus]|uniref:Elongation factor 1 alpha n=1 Tax=Culex quinquefasciatus TaxID=7176 RepID=B0WQT4_CULQU|nr:elongation factor 1 alpha [Culex quinquefasciatus]|eukprot:XP_001851068.1 elongation factor 1 alpha [Culex quinquefasciatus]